MVGVYRTVARVASTKSTILRHLARAGPARSFMARAIHYNSLRGRVPSSPWIVALLKASLERAVRA